MMCRKEKSCGNLNSFWPVLPKNLSIVLEGYTRRSPIPTDVTRCFPKDNEQIIDSRILFRAINGRCQGILVKSVSRVGKQYSNWNLIQNFLCFLALFAHWRLKKFWFNLRTDFIYRIYMTAIIRGRFVNQKEMNALHSVCNRPGSLEMSHSANYVHNK